MNHVRLACAAAVAGFALVVSGCDPKFLGIEKILLSHGNGTVTSDGGLICAPGCTRTDASFGYDGADVTLTATPDGISVFDGWGGDCDPTTAPSISFHVGGHMLCTATFRGPAGPAPADHWGTIEIFDDPDNPTIHSCFGGAGPVSPGADIDVGVLWDDPADAEGLDACPQFHLKSEGEAGGPVSYVPVDEGIGSFTSAGGFVVSFADGSPIVGFDAPVDDSCGSDDCIDVALRGADGAPVASAGSTSGYGTETISVRAEASAGATSVEVSGEGGFIFQNGARIGVAR